MADPRTPRPDLGSVPDARAIARLHAELDDLRTQLAEGVSTQRVVIVDDHGTERARLTADGLTARRIGVATADGFERIHLTADDDHGHVVVRSRTPDAAPTQVDLFALDAEDGADRPYVGIELVDRGTSATGLALYEGRRPRLWTAPDT